MRTELAEHIPYLAGKGAQCMDKMIIAPGAVIGRWTVLDTYEKTSRGEKKWLCRCACGTERSVLERSLKNGGSCSCGCLQREKTWKKAAHDLQGQTFGDLTVLHIAEHQRKNGGLWWTCRCSCGKNYDCSATLLMTGKRTHCGCKTNRGRPIDISGQRFHRLTAVYMLPDRDTSGSVIWHCRCDCGNEVDVSYNNLVYCNMKSCGCQKKEHDQKLGTFLTHVAGTSVDALKSKKVPRDNTIGYKGVYLVHGKYLAKIVFQKKQYFLGTYDNIKEAAEARKDAEEILFDGVVEHYRKWKQYADVDPLWAEQNPIEIMVNQTNKKLNVTLLPDLRQCDHTKIEA